MLNIERRSQAFAYPLQRIPVTSQVDLRSFIKGILRHKWMIACAVALCLSAGLAFVVLATPVFTAEGRLLIDARRLVQPPGSSGRIGGTAELLTLEPAAVDSQVEILKSDQLARIVIEKLGLTTDPNFASPSAFASAFTKLRQVIRGPVEATDEIPITILKAFADRLDVRRVRETYMISVHFKATVPPLAATVANEVMQTYLEREREGRQNAIKVETTWLEERLGQLRDNIAKTDAALRQAATGNGTTVDAGRLQRDAESNRAIYQVFLDRYTSSVQQMSFPFAQASIVAGARTPQEKSFPNSTVVLALSALGGLFIGIGIAAFRDLTDNSFRTPLQAEAMIGRPVFGVLPSIKPRRSAPSQNPQSIYRYVIDQPVSSFAEGLRGMRAAIDISLDGHINQTIGFTSAIPNEGSAAIAANYAYLLARTGKSVLLVDADLGDHSLSSSIRSKASRDLIDIFRGHASIAETTYPLAGKLKFIGCKRSLAIDNHSDEFDGLAIRRFLDQASIDYDCVIFSLPPITASSMMQVFTPAIGNIALVIKWGATSQRAIRSILGSVPVVRDAIAGIVLCDVDMHRLASDTDYPIMGDRSASASVSLMN